MRLIRCHVEGYGRLRQEDFSFDSRLTPFVFENGYGKSTLASFIVAMFYGFTTAKSNAKQFEDRLHYYPFSGGKFGGNLTFEYKGAIYRIERFFDKKSQTRDTLRVYRGEAETDELTERIGERVFGLDRESFMRTVFMDSHDGFLGSTDGINERLGKFAGGDGEISAKDAEERLDAAAKQLKAQRGGGGIINELSDKVAQAKTTVEDLARLEGPLAELYEKREKTLSRIDRLVGEEKKYQSSRLLGEKKKNLLRLTEEVRRLEEDLLSITNKYENGLPTDEERAGLREAFSVIESARIAINAARPSEESENALLSLRNYFRGGVPTEEELGLAIRAVDESQSAKAALAEIVTSDNERVAYLKERFDDREPTDDALNEAGRLAATIDKAKDSDPEDGSSFLPSFAGKTPPSSEEVAEYKELLVEVRDKERELEELLSISGGRSKTRLPLLLVGILLLISGVGACFALLPLGIALLAVGAVLCAVGLITSRSGETSSKAAELKAKKDKLIERIRAFLAGYGYYSEGGAAFDFAALEKDIEKYRLAESEALKRRAQRDSLEATERIARVRLCEILGPYGYRESGVESATAEVLRIRSELSEYRRLKSDDERSQKRREELELSIKRCDGYLKEFFDKYSLSIDDQNRSTILSVAEKKKRLEYLESDKAMREKQTNNLNANLADSLAFVNRLFAKYNISKEISADLIRELDRDSSAVSSLCRDLKTKRAAQESYQKESGISEDELKVDYESLRESFVDPTEELNSQRKALAIIENEIGGIEDRLAFMQECKSELESLIEKLNEAKEKHRILGLTKSLIKKADENLISVYVSPIRARFLSYGKKLLDIIGESFSMDADLNLYFEEGGERRTEKHLSQGQHAAVALAMRLAISDVLFGDDTPFIILDDPFTSLDEKHFARIAKLIKGLSKDTQIVYFTCHNSRAI